MSLVLMTVVPMSILPRYLENSQNLSVVYLRFNSNNVGFSVMIILQFTVLINLNNLVAIPTVTIVLDLLDYFITGDDIACSESVSKVN